eukprot:1161340-Prorocentrum_minimum.AAC.1
MASRRYPPQRRSGRATNEWTSAPAQGVRRGSLRANGPPRLRRWVDEGVSRGSTRGSVGGQQTVRRGSGGGLRERMDHRARAGGPRKGLVGAQVASSEAVQKASAPRKSVVSLVVRGQHPSRGASSVE